LQKQKLEPIEVLPEADWTKQHPRGGPAQASTSRMREMD
jgi:hypothetical protein